MCDNESPTDLKLMLVQIQPTNICGHRQLDQLNINRIRAAKYFVHFVCHNYTYNSLE